MKYLRYLLWLILLSGCYTPKKAQRKIDKAYRKQPEVVAKNASKLFPVKSDTIEYVKWRTELDSIISEIINTDTITDTISNTVFKTKIKRVEIIRDRIKSAPPVYRIDSALIYNYKRTMENLTLSREKYKKRADLYFKIGICILILLLLFCLYYFIRNRK